ncbi:hypothetical protein HPB50_021195 [Hyalomma asiaticum]|uniref:Uncharacterized protein n=1 Tax=Hyalomma asiaticum TaxID=266040 RepID=A0ACB7RVY7_HYAAI|nr:hypothetical protein HPB50_021195 [Hyalomma asiaticum]
MNKLRVLCGDFNAHHSLWGDKMVDARGKEIVDAMDAENLCVANDKKPTFFRPPNSTSVIDLVCNADLRIVVVDPRFPGSCHESWVRQRNPLRARLAAQLRPGECLLARPESSEETRASLSPRFPPCATEPSDESYVVPSGSASSIFSVPVALRPFPLLCDCRPVSPSDRAAAPGYYPLNTVLLASQRCVAGRHRGRIWNFN